MDIATITRELEIFLQSSPLNTVQAEDAVSPDCVGVRFYDEPLIAVADAADPLFTRDFKEPTIIGPHFREPELWLEGAKSVVSFFFPFTEAVRASNRTREDLPYDEEIHNQRCSSLWLHARIEGQVFLNVLCAELCSFMKKQGFDAVAPSISPDFRVVNHFSSNWSERHAAYAAGLGTFGLSKGLITKKGMAGRLASIITTADLPVTSREYSGPFEYCTMCGACQRRCPASAIDVTRGCALGKDQMICGPYVAGSYLKPHGPKGIVRYGCGKCQVGVPCEKGIPGRPNV